MASNPSSAAARPADKPKSATKAPAKTGGGAAKLKQLSAQRKPVGERLEARKVRRLIRHIDPWSVLKMSLLFFFCLWVVLMVALVVVWMVASASGTIEKIESFIHNTGQYDQFHFDGDFLFRQFGLLGIMMTLALTAATTVMAVIFNLISDIIGGVWITVLEEETSRPASGSPSPPSLL